MNKKIYIWFICSVIFLISCKERFEPNLPVVPQGYLVVEGFINAQGPTQIKLSRSTSINQKTFSPELNAQVKVEGDDNSSFSLEALSGGLYSSNDLTLSSERKYRLRINTTDSKEYLSDFVPVKVTPAIDSISWKEEEKGVQIYVNTHDPENKTIYYRYDYDETWEIQSAYVEVHKLDRIDANGNRIIRLRNAGDPDIYTCWKYDTSTKIILGSSAKLEKDIIHLNPILFIPTRDERIGVRYSIQLRQYALNKQGYEFMEQMKKNTEALGTIFDPQPSILRGNIYCLSDPDETVIGYINAATMQQTRIFIARRQLVNRGYNIHENCQTLDVTNNQDSFKVYIPPYQPYDAIWDRGGIIAYKTSTSNCIDCRERGGTIVKPAFW